MEKYTSIVNNNNNNILTLQLGEEYFVFLFESGEIKTTDKIFKNSDSERVFEILIYRHLKNNEVKFREYFRLNHERFDFCKLTSSYDKNTILDIIHRVVSCAYCL